VLLALSMYLAHCIRPCDPTLIAPSLGMLLLYSAFALLTVQVFFISFFSPYLPLLPCGCHSHHSVLSFPNQNPRFGSICGEIVELKGRGPIFHTPPHLSPHPKGIHEKIRYWLEERRKRVRRYDPTRPHRTTQLHGFTNTRKHD